MDLEQEEMQSLGFFGILRDSFKIINMRRKIFGLISLLFILPLTFIFLFQIEITDFLIRKINHNQTVLHQTQTGTASYNQISDLVTSEWTYLLLFKLVYFIFLVILSLLSTSAVVYTIACIYTGREVTFKKVTTIVPKVWKRLMITFLCLSLFYVLYNLVAVFIIAGVLVLLMLSNNNTGPVIAVTVLLLCIYFVGLVYMNIIWQLGCVISVLEDIRGTKALQKSRNLLKGKMVVATIIAIAMYFLSAMIQFAFQKLFVHGGMLGMITRLAYGSICFLLLFKVFLLGFVIHTVLYFVCKSYHHENIDKLALSDHLEVYSGYYFRLKSKDGQLEQFLV